MGVEFRAQSVIQIYGMFDIPFTDTEMTYDHEVAYVKFDLTRKVEDCATSRVVTCGSSKSGYLHSVRSPSRPWQGASSVASASDRRC